MTSLKIIIFIVLGASIVTIVLKKEESFDSDLKNTAIRDNTIHYSSKLICEKSYRKCQYECSDSGCEGACSEGRRSCEYESNRFNKCSAFLNNCEDSCYYKYDEDEEDGKEDCESACEEGKDQCKRLIF